MVAANNYIVSTFTAHNRPVGGLSLKYLRCIVKVRIDRAIVACADFSATRALRRKPYSACDPL